METILFAVGGTIREEGAQSDAEASLEHPDTAGGRRPQPRRAGRICANTFASSLGRAASPTCVFCSTLTKMHLGKMIPFNPDVL
jgi:hypothetical protein